MENKVYNDEKLIDNATAEKMANAFYAVLKDFTQTDKIKIQDQTTVETLLSEILTELKMIREQMQLNRKIRLS